MMMDLRNNTLNQTRATKLNIPWLPEALPSVDNISSTFSLNISSTSLTQFQIFESVFLITCLVVSTLGNGYVIWLSKHRLKRQRHNSCLHLLVLSLSVSDILQGIFQTLPYVAQVIIGHWSCGVLMCKVHAVTRSMLTNISITTLAIIAFNRYVNIEVFDGINSMKRYIIALVSVWVIQCGVAIPLGVWNTVLASTKICNIPFELLANTVEYTLILRVLCYFLPMCVLWLCNVGVLFKMRASTNRVQPFSAQAVNDVYRQRRHHRVTRTCLLLAIVFTINLTPFQAALVVLQVDKTINKQLVANILEYLWLLVILNTCVNPFFYGFCWKDFRHRIFLILASLSGKTLRSVIINVEQNQNTQKVKSNTPQLQLPSVIKGLSPATSRSDSDKVVSHETSLLDISKVASTSKIRQQ